MSDEIHYAELPEITAILDRKAQAKCRVLFIELDSLTAQITALSERADEIKAELEQFQYLMDSPGIRSGNLAFTSSQVAGRRTLNENMLMENGVSREVLDQSYKLGEPYMRRVFKRIGDRDGESASRLFPKRSKS